MYEVTSNDLIEVNVKSNSNIAMRPYLNSTAVVAPC